MTKGRYGIHGGQYMPETLMNAVLEMEAAYEKYKNDPDFKAELARLYREYANRPSLSYYAEKMTKDLGGAKIYLKREDLNHTGAHKINNVLGQILLAQTMGKKRVIAETGAVQHGVATATAAALMNMECVVYMGKQACAMAKVGDGAIVGSAIVKLVAQYGKNAPRYVYDYVKSMVEAVDSAKIGELVMQHLEETDQITYVRFASVYRQLADVKNFMQELERIMKKNE